MSSRSDRLYVIIATLFSVTLVLSNIIAPKLIEASWLVGGALPAGLITYPITFLLTDLVTEIWGSRAARFMVYLAFAMNLLMILVVQAAMALPPSPNWMIENNLFGYSSSNEFQDAYSSVFGLNFKLVVGSMVSYLASQLLDVSLFDYIRQKTHGKHLWLRNNVSTLVSQLVDSTIIGSAYCLWAMEMPLSAALPIIAGTYCFKAIFALCDTPFLYISVKLVRQMLLQRKLA